MISTARAPSNIALIKYMGKEDAEANLPANASLSLTLDSLCTVMEVTRQASGGGEPVFVPELPRMMPPKGGGARAPAVPALGPAGVARMGRHLGRVREAMPGIFGRFGLEAVRGLSESSFEFRSANTFPAASGIASSASSFAAATLAGAKSCAADPEAFSRAFAKETELKRALARLSREGSGSSCRSFEGPWVLWERDSAAGFEAAMPPLTDIVLVVGGSAKQVSSSQAHSLVRTSPLWEGRTARVASRLRSLEAALGEGDVAGAARICWAEMWEMHSLFHTCAEPFSYWDPGSIQALQWLRPWVIGQPEEAPIVTMDAGANVHLLISSSRRALWLERLTRAFPGWEILWDEQGSGASLL